DYGHTSQARSERHEIQTRRSHRGWAHVVQRPAKLYARETKMKRLNQCLKKIFLISIFLGATWGAHAQTTNPVPKDDVQFWNDIQLAIQMSKKVDFLLQGTIR